MIELQATSDSSISAGSGGRAQEELPPLPRPYCSDTDDWHGRSTAAKQARLNTGKQRNQRNVQTSGGWAPDDLS